jgi:hypothetical protein
MSLVLSGSTSGSCTLQEQAIAGTTVLTLPTTSGTVALTSQLQTAPSAVGQIPFSTNGSTYTPTAKIVTATNVSAGGTVVDFTGIPSWVKRITMILNGVSTNGNDDIMVQLGTGSPTTSGYLGAYYNTGSFGNLSTGFRDGCFDNAAVRRGMFVFDLLGSSSSVIWACNAIIGRSDAAALTLTAGTVGLSGTLDIVRLTTQNGSQAFDSGTVNILYE